MTILRTMAHALHHLRAGIDRVFGPLATGRGDSLYWDDPAGQRRFFRIAMHRELTDLYVQHGGLRSIIAVQLLDLSAGGARIGLTEAPRISANAEVMLSAPLPTGETLPNIRARVVWMQPALAGVTAGLEFIALSPGERRRIQSAIDLVGATQLSA